MVTHPGRGRLLMVTHPGRGRLLMVTHPGRGRLLRVTHPGRASGKGWGCWLGSGVSGAMRRISWAMSSKMVRFRALPCPYLCKKTSSQVWDPGPKISGDLLAHSHPRMILGYELEDGALQGVALPIPLQESSSQVCDPGPKISSDLLAHSHPWGHSH